MRRIWGKFVILAKWLLTKQATSAAIDITSRCNLRCIHCYWWKQDRPEELGDGEMIGFMEALKKRGLRAAVLYGGEPTIRSNVCREAAGIFDAVLAFTNGTNGFPHFENLQWILSLDGPREINDRLRGEGVYDLAVKNILAAERPPIVHMTITRLNRGSIHEFVEEMARLPVKGIGFSFYTPTRRSDDSGLFIPLGERDRAVWELLELRKRYGPSVGFTRAMARQLLTRGDYFKWNSSDLCPVKSRVLCFTSDGKQKMCTYGERADCSRCGCAAVVAYRGAFNPINPMTFLIILGLMIPGLRAPDWIIKRKLRLD